MKIKVITTFRDGRDLFEAGSVPTVAKQDGMRFVIAGWAESIDGQGFARDVISSTTDLNIHNTSLGVLSVNI